MSEACPIRERAYARLEGGGRAIGFALMLRDASQRASAVEAPALVVLRCSSARGRRCAAHFGRTRTNLRLWETIAGSVPLFPDCYLQ